jgi:hypothetical protein
MAIPVTRWQLFPKPFFRHWARLALDLPVGERPQTCPGCGIAQDVTGHHRAMCSTSTSSAWKRGHDHIVKALGANLDMSGMPFTTRKAQILHLLDSAKCSDILAKCKVAHHKDLDLDFSLTHPRTCSSTLRPVSSWKPDALANLTQSKNRKHAVLYEQANHAFCPSRGKLSVDFVRFLWMLANSASMNSRRSQP